MSEITRDDTTGTTRQFPIYVRDERAPIVAAANQLCRYQKRTTRGDFIHWGDTTYEETMNAVAGASYPHQKVLDHFDRLVLDARDYLRVHPYDESGRIDYHGKSATEFLAALDAYEEA